MSFRLLRIPSAIVVLTVLLIASVHVWADEPATNPFRRVWERTDLPVAEQRSARSWIWGPEASTPLLFEEYAESPGGQRVVQYYDKSRMEITYPDQPDDGGPWYVKNGRLAWELIAGRLQIGDASFADRSPAQINVAGDEDDDRGPTYASLTGLLAVDSGWSASITRVLHRDGSVTDDPAKAAHAVGTAEYDAVTGHWIAEPFLAFMHSTGMVYEYGSYQNEPLFENPYYATGYPITDAFWANVRILGEQQDVLLQCFERRCLTWTPGNVEGFRTEAGNVGRHYYAWRYADSAPTEAPTPDPTFVPECHPSYPDFCLPPPPPPLGCDDLAQTDFTVLHETWIVQADPHGLDPDQDGIGCESVPISPTPSSAPDPSGAADVLAWVSNASPPRHSSVTIYGQYTVDGQGVLGARMEATWEYQFGDRVEFETCAGSTNAAGIAHCRRSIGDAPSGVPVVITVRFWWDDNLVTTTSFTPQ